MRVTGRGFGLAALALLALSLAPPSAQASLGGVSLRTDAFGMQMTFDQPGSPIPAKPTGEMEVAYSTSDYASGPTSHGLSSIWWPGSAGANAGPVFGFPAYPVRAEAFSPGKPHKSKTDYGPNTTMQAAASGTLSQAETHMQNFGQANPAFVTGDFASSGATSVKGNVAISEGTAQATDVTIAGVIHIDSVISQARAVTNGKNGTVSGVTEVSGVTVQGQGVTVDDKGVHVQNQTVPVFDPINNSQVQQALAQAGVTMKVAKPVDNLKGATAQRALGGLVLTFDAGALNAVIPKQIQDQVKNYVQFNQTITLAIGAVAVDSQTVGSITIVPPPPPPPPPPPGGGGGGGGGGSTTTTTTTGGGGGGGVTLPKPSGGNGGSIGTAPVSLPLAIPPIKSTSVMFIALAFLLAAASSRILKSLADRAVAAKASDRCPLEENR
jgi:hypothetical protein